MKAKILFLIAVVFTFTTFSYQNYAFAEKKTVDQLRDECSAKGGEFRRYLYTMHCTYSCKKSDGSTGICTTNCSIVSGECKEVGKVNTFPGRKESMKEKLGSGMIEKVQ